MLYSAGNSHLRNTMWVKIPFNVNNDLLAKRQIHRWCVRQTGNSSFYYHYAGDHWWFENEQDAIMFKLRWSHYAQ